MDGPAAHSVPRPSGKSAAEDVKVAGRLEAAEAYAALQAYRAYKGYKGYADLKARQVSHGSREQKTRASHRLQSPHTTPYPRHPTLNNPTPTTPVDGPDCANALALEQYGGAEAREPHQHVD